MTTVRSYPVRLALVVLFVAFAGACDGCQGCGCGPTADDADRSPGIEVTSSSEVHSTDPVPADNWEAITLPLTASRDPLQTVGGPAVAVSAASVLIRGETVVTLTDGSFTVQTDEVALMTALREAFGLGEDPVIAISAEVDSRVGMVVLDTLALAGVWPQLAGQSPTGERYRIPFSIPDPAPEPQVEDVEVDHASVPIRGPDGQGSIDPGPRRPPIGRRTVPVNTGPPVVGQRSPLSVPTNRLVVTTHPTGMWVMGGTIGNPIRGLRAVTARSRDHPNHPALQEWQRGLALADWFRWTDLVGPIRIAKTESERRAIILETRVYVEDDLPFELIVRLLDLMTWVVPESALEEGADFEAIFLGQDEPAEQLPIPAIVLSGRLPGE